MNIVEKLVKEHKYSKYRIARLTGVSWNTVQMWYRGVFRPSPETLAKLEEILYRRLP